MNKYEAFDLAFDVVNKMIQPKQLLSADYEYLCKQLEPIIEAYKILKITNKEKSEEILTQMRGEQKSAWSEEDETHLTNTIIMLKEGASFRFIKDDIAKSVDWLKSLKNKYKNKSNI